MYIASRDINNVSFITLIASHVQLINFFKLKNSYKAYQKLILLASKIFD